MDPNYKARKEAFVSDLAGGSIWEINAVTLVAPVSMHMQRTYRANQILGLRPSLVGSTITSVLLYSRQSGRIGDRLPDQCPGHSLCDNSLLLGSVASKPITCFAGRPDSPELSTHTQPAEETYRPQCHVANCFSSTELGVPPYSSISYHLPSCHDDCHMCFHSGG